MVKSVGKYEFVNESAINRVVFCKYSPFTVKPTLNPVFFAEPVTLKKHT